MILRIVSPEKVIYKGEVQMVKLPGTVGQFTILDHHAPLVSTLTVGKLIYRGTNGEKSIDIKGGVVEVRDNNVVVCIN
mgnify:CR=1 FL=1